MPTENDILLRLVIQGQNPAEIERLAASTQGQLNDRMKVYLDQLTQLHAKAAQDQTNEEKKKNKALIDAAEKQVETVQKVQRANEIAANRASNAWRRTLEDMENLTVVSMGVVTAWQAISGRAIALGNDIDKLTNVYGSLKGSIDEMREASKGEISDYDLISTKNRALEKELKLTDEQFGIVARAADNFADSIGVNTKEALDQLIDGLAQGRVRTLAQAGAVIDTESAFDRYAKSIGTSSDKLSEHGKKIAIVQEALRQLDRKNRESGDAVDDFSHRWEKFTAQTKNVADAFKLTLGGAIMSVWGALDSVSTKLAEVMSTANSYSETGIGADQLVEPGKHYTDADLKGMQGRFHRGPTVPEDFLQSDKYKYGGDASESIKKQTQSEIEAAKKAAEDLLRARAEFDAKFQQMLLGGKDQGPLYGLGPNNSKSMDPDDALGGTFTAGATDEYVKENQAKADSYEALQARVRKEAQDTADKMGKVLEEVAQRKDALAATSKRAGGGIFSLILFGPDGPDKTYEQMDAFQQATVDMMGMIGSAATQMAEAVGHSIAASIAGGDGQAKSFQRITHDILEALSAQAIAKGLFEVAEAAVSAAHYDAAGVALHLKAAAAYGAVGIVAGLGARAIGTGEQQTATQRVAANKRAATERADAMGLASNPNFTGTAAGTTRTGSQYGYGGSSSSSSPGNVTINVTVGIGQEAEVGRGVFKALKAYQAETGQTVAAP